jgi:hypothetical protein
VAALAATETKALPVTADASKDSHHGRNWTLNTRIAQNQLSLARVAGNHTKLLTWNILNSTLQVDKIAANLVHLYNHLRMENMSNVRTLAQKSWAQ